MIKLGVLVAALLLLAGCVDSDRQPSVVVVQSGGDSGLSVLLTVALVCAFFCAILAVTMAFLWIRERTERKNVEDVLMAVTGKPPGFAKALAYRAQVVDSEEMLGAYEDRRAIG